MKLVEFKDINRGTIYVNPEYVVIIQKDGNLTTIVFEGYVAIVEESILTVSYKLQGGSYD